jgi:hypothetical protein
MLEVEQRPNKMGTKNGELELFRDHIEDLRSTFETPWEHFHKLREQNGSTPPQIQKRKT